MTLLALALGGARTMGAMLLVSVLDSTLDVVSLVASVCLLEPPRTDDWAL